uniref:Uncharacterized protein n=1 Tax=Arundo donax TaxID=35708 RepID=A0A0A8ZBX1_ARUDO
MSSSSCSMSRSTGPDRMSPRSDDTSDMAGTAINPAAGAAPSPPSFSLRNPQSRLARWPRCKRYHHGAPHAQWGTRSPTTCGTGLRLLAGRGCLTGR